MYRNIFYGIFSFLLIIGLGWLIKNDTDINLLVQGELLTENMVNKDDDYEPKTSILSESKKVIDVYNSISEGTVAPSDGDNHIFEMDEFKDSDVN